MESQHVEVSEGNVQGSQRQALFSGAQWPRTFNS